MFKTWIWKGQILNENARTGKWEKLRQLSAIAIPAGIFQLLWWCLAVKYDYFSLFPTRYYMSITMLFGSVVAGATSEGGGAVAFPVMTLAFGISPSVARDFSLMIQSCGMTAASATILLMHLKIEKSSLLFGTIGSSVGFILGAHCIDQHLSPAQKKLGFVSVFFAFAVALFILNCRRERKVFETSHGPPYFRIPVLGLTGFVGGILTSITGSGVDIASFSVLTLLFHVNEKVATPTSVLLMAANTCFGFFWRNFMMDGMSEASWGYFAVCVPIVVVFAPLGSLISSYFHRLVLAGLIYVLEIIALVTAFVIIKPPASLIGISLGIMVGGIVFFLTLSIIGNLLSKKWAPQEPQDEPLKDLTITAEVEV